jgi:predicted transcriptional regulator
MSDDTTKKLLQLKKKIDDTKEALTKHKGRREELMRRLESDHDVTSEEEARKLLRKLKKDVAKMEGELEEQIDEIEKVVEEMEG